MIEAIVTITISGILIYFIKKEEAKEQLKRDEEFKSIILSLEEKAKKDGTFVRSFFDQE